MTLTIIINSDNAAFEDEGEVARILTELARQFTVRGPRPGRLFDSNGNACGAVKITGGVR